MVEENNNQEEQTESFQKGEEVEGEVSGITSFGAFIKLPNGEEGLVHISEISNSYVTNIADFINLQDTVKVKVLGKNQKGKWDLSMKQVGNNEEKFTPKKERTFDKSKKKEKGFEEGSFDDIMDKFLKKSDEVQLDVRKNLQFKQGVRKKGKKGKFN
jgi:S1 RNA binding domain protein